MMLAILSVTSAPGRREDMVRAFASVIGPTRAEPGCLACGLYQDVGHPDVLHYLEEWDQAEQLERHMRSVKYDRLLAILETSAQAPILRYRSIGCTRGLEYLETVRLGTSPPQRPFAENGTR